MVAPVILIEAQPRRASDGVAVPVRLAGAGGALPYYYDAQHWRAGLTGLPATIARLDFEGEQPGGGAVTQTLEFAWASNSNAALAELASLVWNDAPIAVRFGPEGALPPIVTTGLGLNCAVVDGTLRVALADAGVDLKRPLLIDRYAGTGGLEGPVEWQDQIKSRVWGRCFNVLGRLIDKAHNIWVFSDPGRPIMAFDQVRTSGVGETDLVLLGWQGSAAATFAALQAAVVPSGGGVLCPSIAAIAWWTDVAELRADLRGETAGGYVETAPEIAARIVAARSALGFAAGEVAAAAAARPAPFGWRVDSDSTTTANELSALLGDVSLSWLLIDGAIVLRRWDWTLPQRVARSHKVTRRTVYKPVTARKLGYRRNQAPMQRSDIAAIVFARDVAYEDGTLAESLKPAEVGATDGAIVDPTAAHGALKHADGTPFFPEEILNTSLSLKPDGRLVAVINGVPNLLGTLALPDLGAASDAAQRQFDRDIARFSEAVTRLAIGQARVTAVFRDAGLYTDPVTGVAKLFAIERNAEKLTTLEVSLNAALASIGLKASVDYIDERLTELALDPTYVPDFSAILVRLTSAEVALDGLNASVLLKADATVLSSISGMVSSVQTSLDALIATVSTKASQTIVDAQGVRLTNAEETLSAMDGASIAQAVTASRRLPATADDAATNAVIGMALADRAARAAQTGIAMARQEIVARMVSDSEADASQRLQLAVRIGAVSAAAAIETAARIAADSAFAGSLAAYQAITDGALATVNTSVGAVTSQASATAAAFGAYQTSVNGSLGSINTSIGAQSSATSALTASLASYQSTTNGSLATITAGLGTVTTQVSALSGTVTALGTTLAGHTATLTNYGSSIDGLSAKAGVEIDVDGYVTGWAINGSATRGDMTIRVDRLTVGKPGGPNFTIFDIASDTLYLNGRLKAGSIETPMLNGNVVTRRDGIVLGAEVVGTGSIGTVLSRTVQLSYPGKLIINGSVSQAYTGSPVPGTGMRILFDGLERAYQGSGIGAYAPGFALVAIINITDATPHTVELQWIGSNANVKLTNGALVTDGAMA